MFSLLPAQREARSRVVARAVGSPLAKPIARVALAAAGLVLLALIGRTAVAGSGAGPGGPSPSVSAQPQAAASPVVSAAAPLAATPVSSPAVEAAPAPSPAASPASRTQASPDDPVVLNSAGAEDLRRLPGIGEKRANAILALRAHLGRFRAVEDLLKVKGIGRATLKRLRPLVRLDPPPSPDGGAAAPR
jgi:competence protein ComEA